MRARQNKTKNNSPKRQGLALWARHHRYAMENMRSSLLQGRWTVLINSAILGLSLSLPLALISITNHIDLFSKNFGPAVNSNVFLQLSENVNRSSIEGLLGRLESDPRVTDLAYYSKEDVLNQVAEQLAIETTAELRSLNPFVNTVRLTPHSAVAKSKIAELLEDLSADKHIAYIELTDGKESLSFEDFISVFQRFTHALTIIVLLSTLLLCGYMVRNQVLRQRLEIEVTRYCGAQEAFIRRPFLYWGAAQGFLGALCAGGIVYLCFTFLIAPANGLLPLFYPYELAATVVTGTSLGLFGAWIVAKLHLSSHSGLENPRLNPS